MRLISLLLVVVASVAYATPAHAAPKVAVIDLVKAISDHPQTKVVEDNLRKARAQAMDNQNIDKQRYDKLKAELSALPEGDPKSDRLEKSLLLQQNNMKFNAEWAMLQASRAWVRDMERIYFAVQSVVSKVAREKGIEIVLLRTDSKQKINANDPQDFGVKTRLRVVIFAEPSVDITADVIARLNPSKSPK